MQPIGPPIGFIPAGLPAPAGPVGTVLPSAPTRGVPTHSVATVELGMPKALMTVGVCTPKASSPEFSQKESPPEAPEV